MIVARRLSCDNNLSPIPYLKALIILSAGGRTRFKSLWQRLMQILRRRLLILLLHLLLLILLLLRSRQNGFFGILGWL